MSLQDVIAATKLSISNDPGFNMGHWGHCVAAHVCRAAGYTIHGSIAMAVSQDGKVEHIARKAKNILGIDDTISDNLFHIGRWRDLTGLDRFEDYPRTDKELAYRALDHFLQPTPTTTPEPELVEV